MRKAEYSNNSERRSQFLRVAKPRSTRPHARHSSTEVSGDRKERNLRYVLTTPYRLLDTRY
jgi:hypothetical protein